MLSFYLSISGVHLCSQVTLRLKLMGKRLEASSAYLCPWITEWAASFRGQVPWARGQRAFPAGQLRVRPSPGCPCCSSYQPPPLCSAHVSRFQKSKKDPKAPGYIGSGWSRYFLLSSSPSSLGSWRPRCLVGVGSEESGWYLIHQRRLLSGAAD